MTADAAAAAADERKRALGRERARRHRAQGGAVTRNRRPYLIRVYSAL